MRSTIFLFAAACSASPSPGAPCRSPFDCPAGAVCHEGMCRDPDLLNAEQLRAGLKVMSDIDEEAKPLRMRIRRIDLELQECRTDDCRAALAAERAELEPKVAEIEARRDEASMEFHRKFSE